MDKTLYDALVKHMTDTHNRVKGHYNDGETVYGILASALVELAPDTDSERFVVADMLRMGLEGPTQMAAVLATDNTTSFLKYTDFISAATAMLFALEIALASAKVESEAA